MSHENVENLDAVEAARLSPNRVREAIKPGDLQPASGEVTIRYPSIAGVGGRLIVGVANYPDIDEARAVAERLAEER